MKIDRLLAGVPVISSTVPGTLEISGISIDSRQCRAGDLFFVRKGFREDGMQYVPEALSRGAVALVAETAIPDVPVIVVKDIREALAILARRYYGSPDRDMQVLGITGTNGKTTTAHMIRALVSAHGRCGLIDHARGT